jgi:two-component system, cell cycle sensor histidine kinase and response regulator CckA
MTSTPSSSTPVLPDAVAGDSFTAPALLARVVAESSQAIVLGEVAGAELQRIVHVNPAFERITGITGAEALRGEIETLLAPPDALESWVKLAEDLEAGHDFTVTLPACRRDGTRFWAGLHGYSLRNEGGHATHWVLSFGDVTATHEPFLELRRSEERYRLLAENSYDLITVHRFDGICTYASPAIRSMLGLEPEDMLHKPLETFFHPEDCIKARRVLERHFHNHPENTFVHRLRRKDGTYLWCETSTKTTWHFEGNQWGGLIAVTRDIAKRRAAEEDLQAMHALLAAVYDAVPDGLCIVNGDGEIQQCNGAFATPFGLTPAEVAGRSARELLPEKTLAEGSRECNCVSAHGEPFPAHITITPLHAGPVPHTLVTLVDQRERHAIEARLREAQRLESLGTFAGGIAHDFNNLLAIILGYASLLRQTAPDNLRVGEYGDTIMEAGRRGADVVRQLMLYANQHEPLLRPTDTHALIADTLVHVTPNWPEEIQLECDFKAPSVILPLDSEQVERALDHLLRNAREAIVGAGTVRVRTAERRALPGHDAAQRWLQLTIEDTGRGMDEATRARMFEPFFARHKGSEVRGLGLAVVYGIVRAHRGVIDVESAPGRGTRVHLFFPLPTAAELAPPPAAPTPAETPHARATVLLVEDEVDIAKLWCNLLPRQGWDVLWARDGEEALRLYATHRDQIDVLFSDIGLPGIDGWELCTRLRAERPHLPVLIASGYFKPTAKAQADLAEPVIYVDKPYQPREVLEKMNHLAGLPSTRPA